jgi:tetratricopeptide (TPR) repeat protein
VRFSSKAAHSFLVAWLFLPILGAFAQTRQASGEIEGLVRDSAGKAVAGVSVKLQEQSRGNPVELKTDEAGAFRFAGILAGVYRIQLIMAGYQAANEDPIRVLAGEKKHCEFVLQTAAPSALAATIQLDDRPNFTVAGVTDSSGSGGHGAETRLRTGEALAKETLKLKSPESEVGTPENAGTDVSRTSERQLRSALEKNPSSFEANHELGEFYLHAKRYSDAVPLLDAAYRANPNHHGNAMDLLSAMTASSKAEQARDRAKQLLARENESGQKEQADIHRVLGDIEESLNDPLGAVREYEQAAALQASEENYFAWGSELLLHRAAGPAADVFGKGARLHPRSARMLAGLGAALFTTGSTEEGAKKLCAASDLNPADEAPYLFLGKIQEGYPTALSCAEPKLARFAEREPGNAFANYYYGMVLWKSMRASQDLENLKRAQALFEKATKIDPKLDAAFLQMGNLQFAHGAVAASIDDYSKAIAANPEGSEAHYRLGLAYKRAGEDAKAQAEFEQYKKLEKSETEKIERQRRELRQFLFVLKDQRAEPGQATTGSTSVSQQHAHQ